MAITKVSSAGGSGTSISLACSGTNTLLVAMVTGGAQPASITYNGVSLTHLGSSYLWYLFNPSTGTFNVTLASNPGYASVACFDNVSAADGILTSDTASHNGDNTVAVTLSGIQSGDMLVGVCQGNYGYVALDTGTSIVNGSTHNSAYRLSTGTSQSIQWSGDDNKAAWVLAVREYTSSPSGPANVKKVSSVAIASIKKISGVDIANVKKISGVA